MSIDLTRDEFLQANKELINHMAEHGTIEPIRLQQLMNIAKDRRALKQRVKEYDLQIRAILREQRAAIKTSIKECEERM